jgi:hypothetical protein
VAAPAERGIEALVRDELRPGATVGNVKAAIGVYVARELTVPAALAEVWPELQRSCAYARSTS